jgi:hypothetical protein
MHLIHAIDISKKRQGGVEIPGYQPIDSGDVV